MTDLRLPWRVEDNGFGPRVVSREGKPITNTMEVLEAVVAAMNATQADDRVVAWLSSRDTGLSSLWLVHCLVRSLTNVTPNVPHDADDSERCAKACDALDLWPRLDKMLSHGWKPHHVEMVRARRAKDVVAKLCAKAEPNRFGVDDDGGLTKWYATLEDAWANMGPGKRIVTR